MQSVHWRKLAYWVFLPVGLSLLASILLIPFHPPGSPAWAIWGNLLVQLLSHVLTAVIWGPWQARLSRDKAGSQSIYLKKILKTHWIRTSLITLHALILLVWSAAILN